MKAPKETLKFTGQHAPAINEHDDGTWIKGKPVTLINGSDLFGWIGLKSDKAEGWTIVDGILTSTGHADNLITKDKILELRTAYRIQRGGAQQQRRRSTRSVARRHQQQLSVLIVEISLREIPHRTLRLVVAAAAQNRSPGVVVEIFVRPLPDIADQVHHADCARAFGVRRDVIWPAHRPSFVGNRNCGGLPLVAPWVHASIGSLGGELPLPFIGQALAGPGCTRVRVLLGDPGCWPNLPGTCPSTNRAENSNRPRDDISWRRGTS
jgi:hypothetical protein